MRSSVSCIRPLCNTISLLRGGLAALVFLAALPGCYAQTPVSLSDGLGGALLADTTSAAVTKYLYGNRVWTTRLSDDASARVLALAQAPDGRTFAAGSRKGGGFFAVAWPSGAVEQSVDLPAAARSIMRDAYGAIYIGGDGFLRKLNPDLSVAFETPVRGSMAALAVDATGAVYAGINTEHALLGKLSPDGKTWQWQNDLGPAAVSAIAVGKSGAAYATGTTRSPEFAVRNAAQPQLNGVSDAFAAKVSATGQTLWATYLGGRGEDEGHAVTVSGEGNAVIRGYTTSPSLPGSNRTNVTEQDFESRVDANGNVIESRYLGVPGAIAPNKGFHADTDPTCSAAVTVTDTGDAGGAGDLRTVLTQVCAGGTVNFASGLTGETITLSPTSTSYNYLTGRLYLSANVTIQGPATGTVTISGNNFTRLFFVESGTIALSNLTLANGKGQGGNSTGAGGAAGMGGAIFQNGGSLSLTNVSLQNNQAVGGTGFADGLGSGGGGFGGDAPSNENGAGGGDLGGTGGEEGVDANGGNGGAGAGGGVGIGANAGNGGFGGGGGYSNDSNGGIGGFGGGGGEGPSVGTGGYGGTGGSLSLDSGGGGAGFGGAIFVSSGSLALTGVSFIGNSSTGGTTFRNETGQGQAKGGSLFVYSGATVNLSGSVLFYGSVAADAGSPGIGSSASPYTTGAKCPGLDTADICGTVSGTYTDGTVTANANSTPQSATVGTQFSTALGVTLSPAISGASITFTAPGSGASGTFSNGTNTITVQTNSSGVASATFTANTVAGSYTVTSSIGPSFSLTNVAGPPASITVVSGNGQRAEVGSAFANPLVVKVTDQYSNPLSGVSVTFSGNGIASVSPVTTDSTGAASAAVTANTFVGGYTVTAAIASNLLIMTTFGLTNGSAATCSSSITVTGNGDSGAGTLRDAVGNICPSGTVNFASGLAGQTIALASRLYLSSSVTIQGPGTGTVTISGNNATRIFFVESGSIALSNLTLANGNGKGGDSSFSGGAAGMGGAIFQNGGSLTLTNVSLQNNQAVGGGYASGPGLGGGGFGGDAPNNGNGAGGGDLGGTGGSGGSGNVGGDGGNGGDGAGGGDGERNAGNGGFGGGGGGSFGSNGGNGGFGGGGGSSGIVNGTGGYGGTGGIHDGNGGGGAGFGGAIFVRNGSLTLTGVNFIANSSAGGSGNQNGQAKGGSLFVYSGATVNLSGAVLFYGSVAADAGSPGIGNSAAPYTNGAKCPGLDTVDICGTVSGTYTDVTATANAGSTPQSAAVGTAFSTALGVTLSPALSGASVTFTAPGSGASGTFSNGTNTVTVQTNASGVASAAFTANGTTGSYTVTSSAGPGFALTNLATQTITFTMSAPASAAYNSQFTVAATGGASGNPVTFTSSGGCTNVAGAYTMTSATTACSVIANQAGNTNYAAAATVTQTVNATPATQTITFTTNPPASAVYNTSFTVAATGGASGNAVTFTSAGGCTNLAATYTMTSGTNACSVIANQAGNTNYAAASTVTLSVSATLASQTITFTTNPPASAVYNSQFTVAATGGGSGNAVTFASAGSCSNSGATYTMTSGTGSCSVIANQAGNTNYAAAASVTRTVNATLASQTITFTISAPASAVYNSQFTVAATGGASGNPVSFTSSGACTNSGATYKMTSGTGTCSVIAIQAGNTNYAAAAATETVNATRAVLTVTATSFSQPYSTPIAPPTYTITGFVNNDPPSVVSGAPLLATAATSSSLPGSYPITIGLGTLAAANYSFNLVGGTLTLLVTVGPGACVSFPVMLAAPAGPNGAIVTLTVSDPSKFTFENGLNTLTLSFPAGSTAPSGRPVQVCGVNFGTATVTETGGVAPSSQTVVVQVGATLSFYPASATMTTASQARLTLTLSAPAPAGGLIVNLSSGNPAVATVPATVTIPANSQSVIVPVTGVASGSTLINASVLPNVPDTTASVTVQ